jgi:hypothetical protein
MKLNRLLVLSLALPAMAFAVSPKAAPGGGRAEVQFLEPTKFTDVRGSLDDQNDRNGYLEQLRKHIDTISSEFVPEGQKVQMTFTDIDLAGDFPPGRTAAANSIRVLKDIYPPRMAFAYRITDAAGAVIKEGKEELTDPNYMTTMSLTDRSDPLRYDKELISDWFRKNFKK